jgi:hypothetical protein
MDFVIAGRNIRSGRVAEAVLIAKFFRDRRINLVDGLLLGNLKQAAAGFPGDAFENFLSVGPFFLRVSVPAAATVPAHSRASEAAKWTLILLFSGKQNRIDDCVGALRGRDSVDQGVSLLPRSTPSESTISALRPCCFLMTSSDAK